MECKDIVVYLLKGVNGRTRISSNDLSAVLKRMKEISVRRAILVCYKPVSSQTVEALAALNGRSGGSILIELFKEEDFLFNLTDHVLVPRHTICDNSLKESIKSIYMVRDAQFPRILLNDPVSRYLGARCGELICILRTCHSLGRYTTFR